MDYKKIILEKVFNEYIMGSVDNVICVKRFYLTKNKVSLDTYYLNTDGIINRHTIEVEKTFLSEAKNKVFIYKDMDMDIITVDNVKHNVIYHSKVSYKKEPSILFIVRNGEDNFNPLSLRKGLIVDYTRINLKIIEEL